MKILTSFSNINTAEGNRIAYTYSEIDDEGNILKRNVNKNFVVLDQDLQIHIDAIREYILTNRLAGE